VKNNNCDNDKCTDSKGEVRVLPTGGEGNAILCRACFRHELRFRMERNRELCPENQFDLPSWQDLKVYAPAEHAPQNTDDPECTQGGMPR
jgi:hypothetical protein